MARTFSVTSANGFSPSPPTSVSAHHPSVIHDATGPISDLGRLRVVGELVDEVEEEEMVFDDCVQVNETRLPTFFTSMTFR